MNLEKPLSILLAIGGAITLVAMVMLSLYILIPLALIVGFFLWMEYETKPKKQCKTNEKRKYR